MQSNTNINNCYPISVGVKNLYNLMKNSIGYMIVVQVWICMTKLSDHYVTSLRSTHTEHQSEQIYLLVSKKNMLISSNWHWTRTSYFMLTICPHKIMQHLYTIFGHAVNSSHPVSVQFNRKPYKSGPLSTLPPTSTQNPNPYALDHNLTLRRASSSNYNGWGSFSRKFYGWEVKLFYYFP